MEDAVVEAERGFARHYRRTRGFGSGGRKEVGGIEGGDVCFRVGGEEGTED